MSYYQNRYEEQQKSYKWQRKIAFIAASAFLSVILLATVWSPIFSPWSAERQGMADLRQAAQERRIIVAEAQGELDAAQAQADAIQTMGQAARDYPEYRNQIFIEAFTLALQQGKISELIYIPEGAELPAPEATRLLAD